MPLHDWTRVPSGLFHDFHQGWSVRIADALNAGRLPNEYPALIERRCGYGEMDAEMQRSDNEIYAGWANRIVVRHHLGRIVAVIEILSPGNKDSRGAIRGFVEKTIQFLQEGIHVLVIDLFPPTARDPQGIHKVIWDDIGGEPFTFPAGKDRTLVSYDTSDEHVAYIEPVAVGDVLPDMPLFLGSQLHVAVPLESTYQATWDATPQEFCQAVETGVLPDPDAVE